MIESKDHRLPKVIPSDTTKSTRESIEKAGVDSLSIDSLTFDDLGDIEWSGGPLHPQAVREALERVSTGEVEYLAVRSPDGRPICIGGIDYSANENSGTMWQLATKESLRGLGVGSKLIKAMENKIIDKGLEIAVISVEDTNTEAKSLYERLGYQVYGHKKESWEEVDEAGTKFTHNAEVDLLRKTLN